ncbi:transporter substrate-binding domain-containing protein [Gordonia humi]|uniref:Polar amino acid transport system substrate-binding protein n=1 Tax=Gordonia humi TaxID=686429 RepID=A0A840FAZ0_9ACTN|nr:transporter substrate-binding domain-containing protein [Gordonia humi]MBB4136667.1 polar amino acid transport system substrate-binding protein [Gordonia humi]
MSTRHLRAARRTAALVVVAATLVTGATACSSSDSADAAPAGSVRIGAASNGAADPVTLKVDEQTSISAELPEAVRDSGELTVGLGILPAGSPPLGYVGDDGTTQTGSEPDLTRLIAAVLGLKPQFTAYTWENLFVGIDSGKVDVGATNITVTEERKDKYDFATYRKDQLALETAADRTWTFDGDYHVLAGKKIGVGAGTNQERILLEWQSRLRSVGKDLEVKYFADANSYYLALNSGQIDAYLGPNPASAYHVRQTASGPNPTRIAGTYSGAGASLQGLIAVTTKKDSGLAKPIADAIDYLIANGQYADWLKAWNLSSEAVTESLVNPPGLPRTNA